MSATAAHVSAPRRFGARVWGAVVAGWGVVTGVAPHVLHHAGPLAGAVLLAGFGGKAIFFVLGFVLSLPMLRRLYRRFRTLVAPALAVAVFAAVFSVSNLVIAPRLTRSEKTPAPTLEQPQPSGHPGHHAGGGK